MARQSRASCQKCTDILSVPMSKWAGVRYLRVARQQKGRGVIRLDLGSSDADGTSTGEGGQPDGSPEVMPDKLSEWLASSRHGDDGACPPRAPRHVIDADAASHWQGKTGTSGLMSSGRAQHGRLVQLAIGKPRRPHRSSTLMGVCLEIMLTSQGASCMSCQVRSVPLAHILACPVILTVLPSFLHNNLPPRALT